MFEDHDVVGQFTHDVHLVRDEHDGEVQLVAHVPEQLEVLRGGLRV